MARRLIILLIAFACLLTVILVVKPQFFASKSPSVEELALKLCSPDPAESSNARSALHDLGSNAVPNLLRMLSEPDNPLAKSARNALTETPASIRVKLPVRMLPESAEWKNLCAARALGALGSDAGSAAGTLRTVMEESLHPLRMEAATSLSLIGTASLPHLELSLTNSNPDVRVAALYAIGGIGSKSALLLPGIAPLLDDPSEIVRQKAVWAMEQLGAASRPYLEEKLRSGTPDGRAAAMAAYMKLSPGRTNLLNALAAQMADPDETVRLRAIQLICTMPGQGLAGARILTNSLSDTSSGVRQAAAAALGNFSPAYETTIQPALDRVAREDVSRDVKQAAVTSLASFARKKSVSAP